MKIQKLNLLHFQSHVSSELNLHEGINVISGVSDSGKSAIIKSLYWLINNRPAGEAFKNWNALKKDQMAVELTLDNGSTVAISRQDGKTEYVTDKDTFSTINSSVPEEIKEILNVNEYNIQTQFQKYFLLQDSPGEVAKKLNDLVGLSVIDKLYTNINNQINQTARRITGLKLTKNSDEKDLKKYEKLDEIEKVIESIEKLSEETAVITSSLSLIKQKLSALEKIKIERENLNILLELETSVCSLFDKATETFRDKQKIEKLQNMISNLQKVQLEILEKKEWISLEPTYNDLSAQINSFYEEQNKILSIKGLITKQTSLKGEIQSEEIFLKKNAYAYMSLLRESKICPTCGTEINEACLSDIGKNLL